MAEISLSVLLYSVDFFGYPTLSGNTHQWSSGWVEIDTSSSIMVYNSFNQYSIDKYLDYFHLKILVNIVPDTLSLELFIKQ